MWGPQGRPASERAAFERICRGMYEASQLGILGETEAIRVRKQLWWSTSVPAQWHAFKALAERSGVGDAPTSKDDLLVAGALKMLAQTNPSHQQPWGFSIASAWKRWLAGDVTRVSQSESVEALRLCQLFVPRAGRREEEVSSCDGVAELAFDWLGERWVLRYPDEGSPAMFGVLEQKPPQWRRHAAYYHLARALDLGHLVPEIRVAWLELPDG